MNNTLTIPRLLLLFILPALLFSSCNSNTEPAVQEEISRIWAFDEATNKTTGQTTVLPPQDTLTLVDAEGEKTFSL